VNSLRELMQIRDERSETYVVFEPYGTREPIFVGHLFPDMLDSMIRQNEMTYVLEIEDYFDYVIRRAAGIEI
jgi:hypothetical protein